MEAFVRSKQSEGVASGTARLYAGTLAKFDMFLNGDDATTADPLRVASFVRSTGSRQSKSTIWGDTIRVRAFYNWYYDLIDQDMPRQLRKALKRLAVHDPGFAHEAVITDDEFNALLDSAKESRTATDALRVQTILQVLRDTGFRIGELLSLKVRSFEPDAKGGAYLRLLPHPTLGDEGLKTGVRAVYVAKCLPAIKAWLAVHPDAGNLDAPLLPHRVSEHGAEAPMNVYDLLERLCKRAGIRRTRPHLFRHTSATWDAEHGYNEAMLRRKYGWSNNSEMPAHYVHMADKRLEEQARRDAGVDDRSGPLAAQEKTCPFCAERINVAAIKCPLCREFLNTPKELPKP
jgi:integrase